MKILLEVVGTQLIDGNADKIELTTVGELIEKENEYIVEYTEEQEPPFAPTNVVVKISKNEKAVEMTRSGALESRLVIESSKRNLCHYATEFGDILMGISGHSIDVDFDGEKGVFLFNYDIDMNGALTSRNSVKMVFKNNQE